MNARNLHSWFRGQDFSIGPTLLGHNKGITGLAIPEGSRKLYSADRDGFVRVWDLNSATCSEIINLRTQIGCLISDASWVFVGMVDCVKAWNVETHVQFTLTGPVGQVYAIAVDLDNVVYAGAQDGVITAWKMVTSEAGPLELIGSMKGHSSAVTSLVVGCGMVYSGSMDHTIRMWETGTLRCRQTLRGHSASVSSVLCWDAYLISCSMDKTIKMWSIKTEGGDVEELYSRQEQDGVVSLRGVHDPNGVSILLCSLNDNSVLLYELPSFLERGRIFAKQVVRAIQIIDNELFVTGDWTGLLTVWNWLKDPKLQQLH